MGFTVAIDGPAGSGKSSVARRVARNLGFTYVDTGAMYRAVAWKARQEQISPSDFVALERIAASIDISFGPLSSDFAQRVEADATEITAAIRSPLVSQLTSQISLVPGVRRLIVDQQRRIGASAPGGAVLEGRDIGTVVFPAADVKIFLTADPRERARRRAAELAASGATCDVEQILAEQNERDLRDSTRQDSPLVPAADAVQISTDALTIDEVTAQIVALCEVRSQSKAATI